MLILILLIGFCITISAEEPDILSDKYIELIYKKQQSWKAGRNYPEGTPLEHLPPLNGVLPDKTTNKIALKRHDIDYIASLPESFDARENWPNCPSLYEIRDQGPCGSCWAVSAASAMTDRWCIHSKGTQFHFSAYDIASCGAPSRNGCQGGKISWPWEFWSEKGIVSGGNYNSYQGCKPYPLPECVHGVNCTSNSTTVCENYCIDNSSYDNDKKFGLEPYFIKGEEQIKAEVYKNGPVEVLFTACPDLYHYKSGVYRSSFEDMSKCFRHAVKLLGWGKENGTKYWLLANSWNTYWGELGGFFKVVRGENYLLNEEEAVAGLPKLYI